jgi:hypothetical protein
MLKLTNYLHVRGTYVFSHHCFQGKFITPSMKKDTLIEHKETILICEENGHVSLSYNDLLTTLEANIVIEPVVRIAIAKSSLTCTNYGKIGHSLKTYHNREKEVPIVPTATFKSIELVTKTKTQSIK